MNTGLKTTWANFTYLQQTYQLFELCSLTRESQSTMEINDIFDIPFAPQRTRLICKLCRQWPLAYFCSSADEQTLDEAFHILLSLKTAEKKLNFVFARANQLKSNKDKNWFLFINRFLTILKNLQSYLYQNVITPSWTELLIQQKESSSQPADPQSNHDSLEDREDTLASDCEAGSEGVADCDGKAGRHSEQVDSVWANTMMQMIEGFFLHSDPIKRFFVSLCVLGINLQREVNGFLAGDNFLDKIDYRLYSNELEKLLINLRLHLLNSRGSNHASQLIFRLQLE